MNSDLNVIPKYVLPDMNDESVVFRNLDAFILFVSFERYSFHCLYIPNPESCNRMPHSPKSILNCLILCRDPQ